VAYFPIDTLEGGNNPEDGIAWVNHEYINLMFWSGYTDPEGATRKTKEQISREKAGGGQRDRPGEEERRFLGLRR